ncbi:hypothetical protein ACOSQ4_020479 [Xanthoceras sorbifolium]
MAQIKVVSWVLVVCLMLFLVNTDCKRVLSHEEIIPQATICCREHPELGHCEKGKDDAPNGKCPNFCNQECRGGECKNRNGNLITSIKFQISTTVDLRSISTIHNSNSFVYQNRKLFNF